MRTVVGGLLRGAEMHHQAEGIMCVQVLEGLLDVVAGHISATLEKNQLVVIHKTWAYRFPATEEVIYLIIIPGISRATNTATPGRTGAVNKRSYLCSAIHTL